MLCRVCPVALLAGCLPLLASLLAGAQNEGPAKEQESVEQLIHKLSSPDFAEREAAAKKLTVRPDALPALQQALSTDDPEVRRQAQRLIAAIQRRHEEKALRDLLALGDGEIDQMIDRLVRQGRGVEERHWAALTQLARVMATEIHRNEELPPGCEARLPPARWTDPPQKLVVADALSTDPPPRDAGLYNRRVLADRLDTRRSISTCLIVCRGPVREEEDICGCIIFANGSIQTPKNRGLSDCVVFCDGDVEVGGITSSVVIATGAVKSGNGAGIWSVVLEGPANLPKYLKLFDPRQVGVAVEAAGGGVRVTQVADGRPFARAGVRQGDVVLAVGGAPVRTPDDFRRLVRWAVVDAKETPLRIRRGGQEIELRVDFAR
jgi:hypothetical protein